MHLKNIEKYQIVNSLINKCDTKQGRTDNLVTCYTAHNFVILGWNSQGTWVKGTAHNVFHKDSLFSSFFDLNPNNTVFYTLGTTIKV